MAMKNILAFGDSLTWGFIAGSFERHPFDVRWPNVLAAGLHGKARVIEEGHNGRTTVFDDPTTLDDRNGAKALPMLLSTHTPLDLVIIMLGTNDIKFATNASTKAAEQLPMELLPRLHQMKEGQVALFPNAGGLLIVQLLASQQAPLDLTAATPLIEQFTTNQRRGEIATKEIADLRAAAKIEYQGSFVKSEGDQKPVADAKPAAAAPAPAKGISAESVNKGVAGLK